MKRETGVAYREAKSAKRFKEFVGFLRGDESIRVRAIGGLFSPRMVGVLSTALTHNRGRQTVVEETVELGITRALMQAWQARGWIIVQPRAGDTKLLILTEAGKAVVA
jgi:hypothetical protein